MVTDLFDFVANPPLSPIVSVIARLRIETKISTEAMAARGLLNAHLTYKNALRGISPKVVFIAIWLPLGWGAQ